MGCKHLLRKWKAAAVDYLGRSRYNEPEQIKEGAP